MILLILTLCDMMQTHPAKGDSILLQKWIWLTLSLGIKLENGTFSTFHMRISTDLGTIFIITPSYTSICQCNPSSDWDYEIFRNLPYVHVGWLLLPVLTKENDSGAPLLGLAKSIYYQDKTVNRYPSSSKVFSQSKLCKQTMDFCPASRLQNWKL